MDQAWDLFELAGVLVGLSLFIVAPVWAAATLHTTPRKKLAYGAGGVTLSLLWLAGMYWLLTR